MEFNKDVPRIMHIDLNSCFATIEQQANPTLRGKPIAVSAYNNPNSCILAPSIEAKKLGIKVGMKVSEGKSIYPNLTILVPDPNKYRFVHQRLRSILNFYCSCVIPKSIDEFVLDFSKGHDENTNLHKVAFDIKNQIKSRVGEALTASIGIGSNRFLAKTASNLHKPNGLDEINIKNYLKIYETLRLTDLCGIKKANAKRLNNFGIFTVLDFYNASILKLKQAFGSICGYYWYLRLRGFEIDTVEFKRQSFGNSFVTPPQFSRFNDIQPILSKLCNKASFRMRNSGYFCNGVSLAISFRDGNFWHLGRNFSQNLLLGQEIFACSKSLLEKCHYRSNILSISVSCFSLQKILPFKQMDMFGFWDRKVNLAYALDLVNNKWGEYSLITANALKAKNLMPERIAFGK